uniref:Uncharacterized protein n=1 Tax=Panagrolaimus davidi TaxID=227884 RepID=A0A914QR22_9BILA
MFFFHLEGTPLITQFGETIILIVRVGLEVPVASGQYQPKIVFELSPDIHGKHSFGQKALKYAFEGGINFVGQQAIKNPPAPGELHEAALLGYMVPSSDSQAQGEPHEEGGVNLGDQQAVSNKETEMPLRTNFIANKIMFFFHLEGTPLITQFGETIILIVRVGLEVPVASGQYQPKIVFELSPDIHGKHSFGQKALKYASEGGINFVDQQAIKNPPAPGELHEAALLGYMVPSSDSQ